MPYIIQLIHYQTQKISPIDLNRESNTFKQQEILMKLRWKWQERTLRAIKAYDIAK